MCLKFGVQDPEQWLEDVPDRVWELWKAYYALEPFGGERELSAKMVVLLKRLLANDYKAEAIEGVLKSCDDLAGTEMPWEWIGQQEPVTETDAIDKFESIVAGLYG